MANRLVGGNLFEQIEAMRAQGLSWFDVAMVMRQKYGVTSSHETLRRWYRNHLPDPKPEPEPAPAPLVHGVSDDEEPALGWSA